MILVSHRRNTINQLRDTPGEYGVEVDIRSQGKKLTIHHDPFEPGISLEEWLADYHHALLILNVKEEGLEQRLLTLMKQYDIEEFFFLDQSFPFLFKTASAGEARCAVRYSEFESFETVLAVAHLVNWVWVDCFSRQPLTHAQAQELESRNVKICLVSPELQGRTGPEQIENMKRLLADSGVTVDAVCTKTPESWHSD
jgi:hypothetical protein